MIKQLFTAREAAICSILGKKITLNELYEIYGVI